tara:strand:+ start:201 stop:458 length:258 start_codon:yes stop_codon:yes gene_type:complete
MKTVDDLDFVRDPSMEVYRARLQFNQYSMMISLEKPSNLYAITVSDEHGFVNLDNVNPGVTVTSFLSKEDVNQRIVAMYRYIENS